MFKVKKGGMLPLKSECKKSLFFARFYFYLFSVHDDLSECESFSNCYFTEISDSSEVLKFSVFNHRPEWCIDRRLQTFSL